MTQEIGLQCLGLPFYRDTCSSLTVSCSCQPLQPCNLVLNIKPQWCLKIVFCPCRDLATPTQSLNALLLKHARVSTGPRGEKVYSTKNNFKTSLWFNVQNNVTRLKGLGAAWNSQWTTGVLDIVNQFLESWLCYHFSKKEYNPLPR